ncbi:hypothetical protein [Nocardioides sp. InS609-2]|uniref:hypothetical protein n=1 Tax=Nocardioides sp. InS609-2 TaxID=2760705 RepID=UPI0020BD9AB6|nr:hypothetical protein [Nocardioides sp. InS609-2]
MAREVDIRGDRSVDFPRLDDPLTITHARMFACRYERWDAIGALTNLVSLEVFDWLAPTFDALRPLQRLEQLRVQHLPHVTSLDALGSLSSLRRLILETRPSWDGSKVTQVDTLEPLRGLPLEEVNMFGVRPASKSVDDLLAIPTLKKARLPKFAAKEIRRINPVIPNEFVEWQEPSWGSAAEVEKTKEALPTGVSFRTP